MVAFLLPLAAGLAGGGIAGLFSGGKKEIHAEQEHFAPTYGARTYSPVIAHTQQSEQSYIGPTYISGSPGASTKKEVTMGQEAESALTPSWNIPTAGAERSETEGLDVAKIAIIAVIGAVAVTAVGAAFGGKSKTGRRK